MCGCSISRSDLAGDNFSSGNVITFHNYQKNIKLSTIRTEKNPYSRLLFVLKKTKQTNKQKKIII